MQCWKKTWLLETRPDEVPNHNQVFMKQRNRENWVEKTLLQIEIEKDAQMKYLKRLSQDHKYNEIPHDRSLRLHSSPKMEKLLCWWTYQCGFNMKEIKVVDKEGETPECKVKLEVLVDA